MVMLCIITLTLFMAQVAVKARVKKESSYSPVIEEPFEKVFEQDKKQKEEIMKRQMDLLAERFDLSKKTISGVNMSRGKPLPIGPGKPGSIYGGVSGVA